MSPGALASPLPRERTTADDGLLPRLGRGLLLLLAFVLPFETPLFRAVVVDVTTVELVIYATLAVWLAYLLDRLRASSWRDLLETLFAHPLARASSLFAAALFASAFAAPSYRGAAIKFALRSLSGILLFFATKSLVRRQDVRRVWLALLAGAVLSAVTALVDHFVPASDALWSHFREGHFGALGLRRASGVFGYPTIGAMYWEAAVPLVVALPFVDVEGAVRTRGGAPGIVVALGSALLVSAILASGTRSGLAGTAVACLTLFGLARRFSSGASHGAGTALVVTLAIVLGTAAFGSLLGQRLLFWRDKSWFRVEYQVGAAPRSIHTRESFEVPVTLHNTGILPWERVPPNPIHLSYHWERPGEGATTLSDFEGLRTELTSDVPPGGAIDLVGRVEGPIAPGIYRLSWDLVEEGVSWFSERGNPKPGPLILVESAGESDSAVTTNDRLSPAIDPLPPSRPELWRAAVILWTERPLLGIGPDNFRRRYGGVLSAVSSEPPSTDTRIHANSLYFETLADLGLVGVAALACIAVALVRVLAGHGRRGSIAGLGSAVAACAFFVHGALDYFFEFTPLLGLFWLLLGLTAASDEEPAGAPPSSTRSAPLP